MALFSLSHLFPLAVPPVLAIFFISLAFFVQSDFHPQSQALREEALPAITHQSLISSFSGERARNETLSML
jgi:hypothetical protein